MTAKNSVILGFTLMSLSNLSYAELNKIPLHPLNKSIVANVMEHTTLSQATSSTYDIQQFNNVKQSLSKTNTGNQSMIAYAVPTNASYNPNKEYIPLPHTKNTFNIYTSQQQTASKDISFYSRLGSHLNPSQYEKGKPTFACVVAIAQKNNIPVDLFLGIQSVERGQTSKISKNTNATYDIGAFQINSIHIKRVKKLGGTERDLLDKGCYNAEIAAILLSESLFRKDHIHKEYYTRASGYHSWTPSKNSIYRGKLVNYTRQWQSWLNSQGMNHLVTAPRLY